MTQEERLSSIDSNLAALNQRLTDHTDQDELNFAGLVGQISGLDGKLDRLLLREASREGESRGFKRSALILAGTLSIIVSAAGVVVAAYVR